MEVEVNNAAQPSTTTEERSATVNAVDHSALTPTAMRGLRDIGSQVTYICKSFLPVNLKHYSSVMISDLLSLNSDLDILFSPILLQLTTI